MKREMRNQNIEDAIKDLKITPLQKRSLSVPK